MAAKRHILVTELRADVRAGVIHGPVLTYGRGDAPKALQSWALENALLAHVGPTVAKAFERPMLNGVKLVFGFGDEIVSDSSFTLHLHKRPIEAPEMNRLHN